MDRVQNAVGGIDGTGGAISTNFSKDNDAVSEVVGTLFLITLTICAFSAITLIVLDPWANFIDESPPSILLVGYIHDNAVIVEHRGGVPLNPPIKFSIDIAGTDHIFNMSGSSYWDDTNGDGKWSVGEQVVYPGGNLQGKRVGCVVIDVGKNSILFDKIIQNGSTATTPYATVLDPLNITETSATIKMYYNFVDNKFLPSGLLNFTYGPYGGPFVSTPAIQPLTLDSIYGFFLNGLTNGTLYEYWASVNYSGGCYTDGPMSFYTYQDVRGLWHFDEPNGALIAHDAIHPTCNGSVSGAEFKPNGITNDSLEFQGESEYVDVPHNPKFNLTNTMSIETWLNISKAEATFPGNIVEIASKNVSEILGNICDEPDLIPMSGSLYAVVYHDNVTAYVTTFQMSSNGVVLGVIDTKSIAVPHFFEPDIIQIYNNVYAIVFGASDDQVEARNHIVTLTMYSNGTIGDIIETYDFPVYYGREAKIINIAPNVYALAIGGTSYQIYPTGYLVTIAIDNSGHIGPGILDTYKFVQSYCSEASIVHIANSTYVIAYDGFGSTAGNGYLITVNILDNGSIVQPLVDSYQFIITVNIPNINGSTDGLQPTILPVTDGVFVVAYGADSNNLLRNGFLQTVRISSQGVILNGSIDNLLIPIDYCSTIEIFPVNNQIFALAFSGGNDSNWQRGIVLTILIADNGNISNSILACYVFNTYLGLGSTVIPVIGQSDRFIIVYGSTNTTESGFLGMVKIDSMITPRWILHKGDAFSMKVNYDLIIASMTVGNSTFTVTGSLSLDNWTKVDLTYGMGFLKLYIDDVIQTGGDTPCTGSIKTNSNHLIFGGGLYGRIDEIKIFRSVYVPH
jgi:hypothetical protein